MSSSSRNGGPQTANAGIVRSRDPLCRSREKKYAVLNLSSNIFDWVETWNCISALCSYQCQARGGGGGGPRAYVGHLTSRDPYHVPDILDLKRGWTGIDNAHAIFRMHNLFCVHCLCPSSLNSNSKWRLRELIEFLVSLSNKLYATQFSSCFNVKYNHVLKEDWHPATIISYFSREIY